VVVVAEDTVVASAGVDERTVMGRMLEFGDTVQVLAQVPYELTWP